MSDFSSFAFDAVLHEAVDRLGFDTPTPIQTQAIPLALEGHDILGLAQTGTGKTLAFGLPLVNAVLSRPGKPQPKTAKSLILAPTRELANQIAESLRALTERTRIRILCVVGGQSIGKQISALSRGADILVATPGRLIDLMDRGAVDLASVRTLVLDEADQMLDQGFIHALRRIAPKLGKPRQTMLFSATMPKQMEELSAAYLDDPRRVQVATPGKAADKVTQSVHHVDKAAKSAKLRELLERDPGALTLVFARTKHGAERLMKGLVADGFDAASIHGNKSQGQRDRALKAFRAGRTTILVATDVAARGIDIPGVAYVINYDLPDVPENYVHRIGRTARAGREGEAIALCAPEEFGLWRGIERLMKIEIPVAGGVAPASEPSKAAPARRRRRTGGGGKPGAGAGGPKPAAKPAAGQQPRRRQRRRPAA
ncbi:MAG: DEAD/DEAH box helicase [Pseudomonadota bacterium]